jgi:diguanylate cyclase (GGDEF)-like protein/PAS domain S-box-containing protein
MDQKRSTEKGLIVSFIAFSCIILFVGIISLVSINRTMDSVLLELGQLEQSNDSLFGQAQQLLKRDTFASSIIVASGSLFLILFNFFMTFGGLKFTRKEKATRDRIEKELRSSNEKLSSVIEGTHVGTWVWDIPTGNIEINARWAQIVGYTLEELGSPTIQLFKDFLHPDDLGIVDTQIEELMDGTRDFFEAECRMHHKDETWVWVLDRGKITKRSESDEPVVMSGTHADITDAKLAKSALEKSESSHRKLVEHMNQGLLVCKVQQDTNNQIVDAIVISMNRRFEQIIQISAENIVGSSVEKIFASDKSEWIALFNDVVVSGKPITIERYSSYLDKQLRISAYSPEPLLFAAIIDDITESRQTQNQLALQKARLETTLLSVGDGVITLDRNGCIEIINNVAQTLTKWHFSEAIGKSYEDIIEFGEDDIIKQSIVQKQSIEAGPNAILIVKSGDTIPIEAIASPIFSSDKSVDGIVLVFRDCTEKRQKQQNILHLSYSDPMTGLKNRRAFEKESLRLNHVRYCPLVLVIADVNNLKLTNDAFGHDAGDTLLQTVADILRKESRETDIVARIGGDEFVLLLPNTDAEHANSIIERINNSISKAKVKDMPISVSLGKSIKLIQTDDMDVVFREAEHEMYRKKIADRPQIRKRIIDQLLISLFEQNKEEQTHSEQVSKLCRMIAEHTGLSEDEVDEIGMAGTMHDIGKIALRPDLFKNENHLHDIEKGDVLRHPEIGYNILSAAPHYGVIAEYVLTHHERWDGTGYPSGLKGTTIPLQGRILALADSYAHMTREKPFGAGFTETEALEHLSGESGTKYDPQLIKLFTQLITDTY